MRGRREPNEVRLCGEVERNAKKSVAAPTIIGMSVYYEHIRCSGSEDSVLPGKLALFIIQEMAILKHEIRADFAVFRYDRSIALRIYQRCITCFAEPAPLPFTRRAAGKRA